MAETINDPEALTKLLQETQELVNKAKENLDLIFSKASVTHKANIKKRCSAKEKIKAITSQKFS